MFSWIFNSNTNDDLHFVNDMITFYNEKFKSINTHNISEEQKEIKKKNSNNCKLFKILLQFIIKNTFIYNGNK